MAYDRQLIAQFLNGAGDNTITTNTRALSFKAKRNMLESDIVTLKPGTAGGFAAYGVEKLRDAMQGRLAVKAPITTRSRIYLQAHGDWQSQQLAEWSGEAVAGLLADAAMPAVKLISILGCELGRDLGTANQSRIGNSMNSFASVFHKSLKEDHGIKTTVYARIYCVFLGNPKDDSGQPDLWGRKASAGVQDQWEGWGTGHHREHSKIRLRWIGGVQVRDWAT